MRGAIYRRELEVMYDAIAGDIPDGYTKDGLKQVLPAADLSINAMVHLLATRRRGRFLERDM